MLFHSTVQAQLYSAPWVQPQAYNGPDDFDCTVDVLLERYLNNPLVKEFCWIYYYGKIAWLSSSLQSFASLTCSSMEIGKKDLVCNCGLLNSLCVVRFGAVVEMQF